MKELNYVYNETELAKQMVIEKKNIENENRFINVNYENDWVLMCLKDHPNYNNNAINIWQESFRVVSTIGNENDFEKKVFIFGRDENKK